MSAGWDLPPSLADRDEFGRLERFRAAHPEWLIQHGHDYRYWQAIRQGDGETIAVRHLLGELLDHLADILAAPDPGG